MRFPRIAWAILSLLPLCSCQKKTPLTTTALPTPGATPAAAASSPPTPPMAVKAAPEQIGSVLRVRVAFGGLPPRDMAAALLHRDEIPDASLASGNARFVLALLKGWQEAQLRSPSAHVIVYRNKVDGNGQPGVVAFAAQLVQLDAATGLGVFVYSDDFEASADVGFRLGRHESTGGRQTLLRTSYNASAPLPVPERSAYRGASPARIPNGAQPFAVDADVYDGPGAAAAPAPPPPAVADPVKLLLDASGRLAGFAETTPAGTEITSAAGFAVALRLPTVELTNVTFESAGTGEDFRVILALDPAANEIPVGRLQLRSLALAPGGIAPELPPPGRGSYAPITGSVAALAQTRGSDGSSWSARLPQPAVGQAQSYLLQISWPLVSRTGAPEIFGRPFLLKIERRPDGLYPAATGLPGAPPDPGGDTVSATKFPLEGPAGVVHLVAGGREALIQMSGPPYWKRFSFEKDAWLPLPGPLANVAVTGNLNAVFVLDRAAKEVRKFRLPGLEPAGVVKLPPGDYLTILAGCDSAHAPVHVLAVEEAQALDPDTLQRRDVPRPAKTIGSTAFAQAGDNPASYAVTGDGLSIVRLRSDLGTLSGWWLHYNGDLSGLERSYFGVRSDSSAALAGVTGGFSASDGASSVDRPGGQPVAAARSSGPWSNALTTLSENCPVTFRLLSPRKNDVPPRPPRLGCFAFASGTPFVEIEAPELAGLLEAQTVQAWRTQRWVFLDPYTRQIATLSPDRRTWCVRKLAPESGHLAPALLNWPDTSVARGGRFSFQPQLTGPDKFAAALHGRAGSAVAVNEAAGTVELPVAADEFDTVQLLDFAVQRDNAPALAYPLALHLTGLPLPFVAPPATPTEGLDQRGTGLASLGGASNQDFRQLPATLLRFADPVSSILGVTAGHAVFLRGRNHLDFFSLQTRQVVSSVVGPPGAWYYPGAGALLEYDPGKRTLSRISVPAGRYEQVLPFPAGVELCGIGVGAAPDSPVTLALQINQGGVVERFLDLTVSTILFHDNFVVLDGRTLRPNGRAQPLAVWQVLGQKDNPANHQFAGFIGSPGSKPVVLPASRSGALVYLPQSFLVLAPNYAVAYPFGSDPFGIDLAHNNAELSGGSLTGLMAFAATGQAYKGGIKVAGTGPNWEEMGPTPDGRYQLHRVLTQPNANCLLDVRLAENGLPLLRVARLAFMEDNNFRVGGRRAAMLGDEGPLAILSASGRAMELVDLNIPNAAKALSPEEFHVTSQPAPFVMEGQSTQYQLRVNNPEAVQSYRLVGAAPGASLSPTGLLSYRAPSAITGPTHATISIEIRGRNGQVVLHEFPIYVLPAMRASAKLGGGQI